MKNSAASSLERERKKQDHLIRLVSIHGDEGKAAGVMRLTRAKLLQWLKDEGFRTRVEKAKGEVADQDNWLGIMFQAKIEPFMKNEATRTKSRKSSSSVLAAWVAYRGLKNERAIVFGETNAENKKFFIALGRLLGGDLKLRPWDKTDETIARNWSRRLRTMSRAEGAKWMRDNGFPRMSEVAYRQRLVGLKLTRWNRKIVSK